MTNIDRQDLINDGLRKRAGEIDKTWPEIGKQYGVTGTAARNVALRAAKRGAEALPSPANDDVIARLKRGATITDIAEGAGSTVRVAKAQIDDLIEAGYNIELDGEIYILSDIVNDQETAEHTVNWRGERVIRFGLCGDTQINSKYTQITHLHTLYDIYAREGIKNVYHTGDIDEGEDMRKGHKYECYTQGADDHVAEIVKVYPVREGITTWFITGNHDLSFIKHVGMDIGKAIEAKRPDMRYLGRCDARIHLTPNCTMDLVHPWDGTAYSLSYKLQKMIESLSGGEKPNLIACGHYHKEYTMFYRNVHAICTGCLQAQTPFMRSHSIAASMGGFIIELHVDDEGTIQRIIHEFIPFYKAIKDDYLSWR